jgi:hypothetical protein
MSGEFETIVGELTPDEVEACAALLLRELERQVQGTERQPDREEEGMARGLAAAEQLLARLEQAEQTAERIAADPSSGGNGRPADGIHRGDGAKLQTSGADASAAAAEYRIQREMAEFGAELYPTREVGRYAGESGRRGLDMGRMSDYFRRDSRRYDAGFVRY